MLIVLSVYGSTSEHAPIFAGYAVPTAKAKEAICVYDTDKKKCVWILCPHIDYMVLQRNLVEYGLMWTEARLSCDLNAMKGDGTVSCMKVLPPTQQIFLKEHKVSHMKTSRCY